MLIVCPECFYEFSSRAHSCPKCGLPVSEIDSVREEKNREERKYIEEHSFYSKDLQEISKDGSQVTFSLLRNHPLGFKVGEKLTFSFLGFTDHLLKVKHGIYLLEGNEIYKKTGFFSSERIASYAIARLENWESGISYSEVWYTGVDEGLTDFRPWIKPPKAGSWRHVGILKEISSSRKVRCVNGVLKIG